MTTMLDEEDVFARPGRSRRRSPGSAGQGARPGRRRAARDHSLAHGQRLLRPSEYGGWFGVKIATVAPGNAARRLRRINVTCLLHDSATLTRWRSWAGWR